MRALDRTQRKIPMQDVPKNKNTGTVYVTFLNNLNYSVMNNDVRFLKAERGGDHFKRKMNRPFFIQQLSHKWKCSTNLRTVHIHTIYFYILIHVLLNAIKHVNCTSHSNYVLLT